MQYPLRFLYILLMFIVMNSYMQEPPKKVVLNGDVTRIIERMYLERTPARSLTIITEDQPSSAVDGNPLLGMNWNSKEVGKNFDTQMPQCVLCKDYNQISFENLRDKKHLLTILLPFQVNYTQSSSIRFESPNNVQIQFDGPNQEDVVLINKASLRNKEYVNCFCVVKLESTDDPTSTPKPSKSYLLMPKLSLKGFQTQSMALASKKIFAIATQLRNATGVPRDWLSWYEYHEKLPPKLIKYKVTRESLKKIAFLVNSTLIGLAEDGSLHIYWFDSKEKQIKSALQKLPLSVIDFAVDPKNKGMIALALKDTTIKLAVADIFHRDSQGCILFQSITPSKPFEENVPNQEFHFYDNSISYDGNFQTTDYYSYSAIAKPYWILKIHQRTRFKLTAIKAPIE